MKEVTAKKLVSLIPRATRMMRSHMRQYGTGEKLSVPQFRVLANIKHGTTTTSSLAELHGVSIPAMSKIVDGLVKRDLIVRLPHKGDRRVIELGLTSSGKKLLEKITGSVEETFKELLGKLTEDQCHRLLDGLQVLETFLG